MQCVEISRYVDFSLIEENSLSSVSFNGSRVSEKMCKTTLLINKLIVDSFPPTVSKYILIQNLSDFNIEYIDRFVTIMDRNTNATGRAILTLVAIIQNVFKGGDLKNIITEKNLLEVNERLKGFGATLSFGGTLSA